MRILKNSIGVFLGISSAWLILIGIATTIATLGQVRGSEFSALISIANLVSSIALWLGLFGAWSLVPSPRLIKEATDNTQAGT